MSSPYSPPILTTSLPLSPIRSHQSTHDDLINLSPMADRFPDLDDFGAGTEHTSPHDPDGDFLTRERAALGPDAAQFAADDHAARVDDGGEEDLLGGDGGNNEMMDAFEAGFPAVDEAMAPSGTKTGSATLPFQSSMGAPQPNHGASNGGGVDDEEPEAIKTWRALRTTTLTNRADLAASQKASTIAQAQAYVDEFYNGYNVRKEKGMKQTREEAERFVKGREDTSTGGTSWERVARLVDLGKKGAEGKERFRELVLGLRGDGGAPGAGGY